MCRLIAYLGQQLLMENVLIKPHNSLVKQSIHASESTVLTNGDGFGLGWYAPHISIEPALFTSIFPAWNDRNLLTLAAKIQAPTFFAHVRSASSCAIGVTHYNCHPFIYKQWMFMHNGAINNFNNIKRPLRAMLDIDLYQWIKGDTDSEHLFALFLQLAKNKDISQLSIAADVLRETFDVILQLVKQSGQHGESTLNICLTDGHQLLVSRFCTNRKTTPESLHYSVGSRCTRQGKHHRMLTGKKHHRCILVASEKLTNFESEWQDLPKNHLMLVDSNLDMSFLTL